MYYILMAASSEVECNLPATSSMPPSLETSSAESDRALVPTGKITTSTYPQALCYVKLDPFYAQSLTWSNEPRDLDLYGAFDEEEPNLSIDFNVQGLRPILIVKEGETYLLKDASDL